jgi:hypothetical protein
MFLFFFQCLCFHIRNLSTTLAQLFCPSQYECFWPIWLCFTCCFFLWFVCWGWHNFVVGGFRLLLYCCLDFDYFSSTMILLKRYTLHYSGQGLLCIMRKLKLSLHMGKRRSCKFDEICLDESSSSASCCIFPGIATL